MRRLLLRCPEITLKGRNQNEFRNRLAANVRHLLRSLGAATKVAAARGRIYVDLPPAAPAREVVTRLRELPGVESLSIGEFLDNTDVRRPGGALSQQVLERALVGLARRQAARGRTFAVRVKRLDKSVPETSEAIAAWLGAAVRRDTDWQRVDLEQPDRALTVDLLPDGVLLADETIRGVAGLPVGSAGRVLALLSGGIDSPVAAFLMAKRGCRVDLLHLSVAHPATFDPQRSPVGLLARRLSQPLLRTRLIVAPYGPLELALLDCPPGFELIVFRRFLARLGATVANHLDARALVTGDSLAQVASQTLDNLVTCSRAISTPILRPLIGFNKQEIIALARELGTYETSILPQPDCCALLARHPRTRTSPEQAVVVEHDVLGDSNALIERVLEDAVCYLFDTGSARAMPALPWRRSSRRSRNPVREAAVSKNVEA